MKVWAPEDEVLARATRRGVHTGRVIPPDVLQETFRAVPASVEMLAPLTDYCVRINNSGRRSSEAAASTSEGSRKLLPRNERCQGVVRQEGVAKKDAGWSDSEGDIVVEQPIEDWETGASTSNARTYVEPDLPEGFPVLATPGETWGSFKAMFSQTRKSRAAADESGDDELNVPLLGSF